MITGIVGTAPTYSIEITTSTIIGTADTQSPASILVHGLIMLGIAYVFISMNHALAGIGTSYSWVSMVFGCALGFFAGWTLLVLRCVFMMPAMILTADTMLLILDRPMMNNAYYVTLITVAWFMLVSMVTVKGVELISYTQVLMTIVESVVLLGIIVMSFMVFPRTP